MRKRSGIEERMIEIAEDRDAVTERAKDRDELTETPSSTLGRPKGQRNVIYNLARTTHWIAYSRARERLSPEADWAADAEISMSIYPHSILTLSPAFSQRAY